MRTTGRECDETLTASNASSDGWRRLVIWWGALWIAAVALGEGPADVSADPFLDSTPIDLPQSVLQCERSRTAAVATAMPSATSIYVPGGGGGGSGVVVDPAGFALTNFHVTSPAGNHMQCSMADGKIYDAVIVGIDPVGDLAMVQLLSQVELPAAELGESRDARPGDRAIVIGNPFLLAGNLQPTVTCGILSGVGRYQYPSGTLLEYGDCLQTDASVNPGNSGGPLYDGDGKLIGIVGRCSFEKRGRVNVGVGYAISIHQAMNFAGALRVGLIVDHATLGATVATDPDGGVRVSNLLTTSDAYRRGLRYDSEILRIDGRSVTTANDVQNILATYPARWRIPLTFRPGDDADGEIIETVVRLGSVHRPDELLAKMAGATPPPPPAPPSPPPERPGQPPLETPPPDEDSPAGGRDEDMPASVDERFEAKRGFANFHFNLEAQRRFIESLRRDAATLIGDDATDGKTNDSVNGWTIEATKLDGDAKPVEEVRWNVTAAEATAVGDPAAEAPVQPGDAESVAQLLRDWLAMVQRGPSIFGDTVAVGTQPLAGRRPLRHVTRSTSGEVEVTFYQSSTSDASPWNASPHQLEVIERSVNPDEDPIELWIRRNQDGRVHQLQTRIGIDVAGTWRIDRWSPAGSDDLKPEPADGPSTAEISSVIDGKTDQPASRPSASP